MGIDERGRYLIGGLCQETGPGFKGIDFGTMRLGVFKQKSGRLLAAPQGGCLVEWFGLREMGPQADADGEVVVLFVQGQLVASQENLSQKNAGVLRSRAGGQRIPEAREAEAGEVFGVGGGEFGDAWRESFAEGWELFSQKQWDAAEKEFKHTLDLKPEDGPSLYYLARLPEFRASELPPDWHGRSSCMKSNFFDPAGGSGAEKRLQKFGRKSD